jgi:Tfp pilus assembly protein PilF
MELYNLRALKENSYGYIGLIKGEVKKDGETRDNQLELAQYYLQVGQFDETRKIASKYLSKAPKDISFLFLQLNIEMALGNVDKMKSYKSKILKIDPAAFEKK